MGYSQEEVAAAFRLLSWATGAVDAPPAAALLSGQGVLSRHGLVEPLVKLPFAAAGRALAPFFPGSPRFAERVVTLVPVVETALLASLLFLWATQLTASPRRGLVLALGGAFGTLLWPYAYCGLEPTQALALLAAGYLALGSEASGHGGGRAIAFAAAAAVAVAAKSTGALLLPAVAFLIFQDCRRRSAARPGRRPLAVALATFAVVVAAVAASRGLRNGFQPAWIEADTLRQFLELNPVRLAASASMLLFSGNKGLLFYSPLAFLGMVALPSAWRSCRTIAIFALLVLGAVVAGFSVVGIPAEETWGPRYLYCAVAPLLVCLAAAWGSRPLDAPRRLALALALVIGFGVSALGSLFYYGRTLQAAQQTGQATLEALWGDPVWNPIVMHLRLARLRLAPRGTSTVWTPQHHWWFERPAGMPPDKSVDLAFAREPQPLLLGRAPRVRPSARGALLGSLLAGLGLLIFAARATRSETWCSQRDSNPRPSDSKSDALSS